MTKQMTKQEKIILLKLLLKYLRELDIPYEKTSTITIDDIIELLMYNYIY